MYSDFARCTQGEGVFALPPRNNDRRICQTENLHTSIHSVDLRQRKKQEESRFDIFFYQFFFPKNGEKSKFCIDKSGISCKIVTVYQSAV